MQSSRDIIDIPIVAIAKFVIFFMFLMKLIAESFFLASDKELPLFSISIVICFKISFFPDMKAMDKVNTERPDAKNVVARVK